MAFARNFIAESREGARVVADYWCVSALCCSPALLMRTRENLEGRSWEGVALCAQLSSIGCDRKIGHDTWGRPSAGCVGDYMSEGFVYLLTNEAMPGYVKIGLTRGNDVAARMKQLDTTAVPLRFECHFAARVPDCAKLERTLHFVFGEKRARLSREFFKNRA